MDPKYVIFLGPPGSGKGTQAKRLVQETGIPHVSTGDLFRAMKVMDTPLARRIQDVMNRGEYVSDEITIEVLKERISRQDVREQGAILDGFPRTVPQAEALDQLLAESSLQLSAVLFFDITEDEAVRRISGRRSCPECGRIYHVEFDPPEVVETCDADGVALVQRGDDYPDVVRERYQVYLAKTSVLVDYYREKDVLIDIDAMRDPDRIAEDVAQVIAQE
nr:adenylate kinase [Anaerolineae bacterium]